MHNCSSHSMKRAFVDVFHRIIDGVPVMTKTFRRIFIVLNNIDTRNACYTVYIQMIVGNCAQFFVDEMLTKTKFLGFIPYFFDDMRPYRDWETDRKSTRLNSSH